MSAHAAAKARTTALVLSLVGFGGLVGGMAGYAVATGTAPGSKAPAATPTLSNAGTNPSNGEADAGSADSDSTDSDDSATARAPAPAPTSPALPSRRWNRPSTATPASPQSGRFGGNSNTTSRGS